MIEQEVIDGKFRYAEHHDEAHGKEVRHMIWVVFWILLVVTCCELILGTYWRTWQMAWDFVKALFIAFTIVKSYYIVAYYMHMRDERKSFRYTILIPYIALGLYAIVLFINEGSSLFTSDLLMRW